MLWLDKHKNEDWYKDVYVELFPKGLVVIFLPAGLQSYPIINEKEPIFSLNKHVDSEGIYSIKYNRFEAI